jgi:predicted nucleotidyltransferase
MRRHDTIEKLKATESALRDLGVIGLYLFGSHARDQAGPDSDVDVFIDPKPDRSFGFLNYMDAFDVICGSVGGNVDYGTRNGLHPLLRPEIERESIRIF